MTLDRAVLRATRAHATPFPVAGIASAIYQSLTFTAIHDLMVTLSFLSFLIAAGALLHWLYLRHAGLLLLLGTLSIAILGIAAALYYTGSFGRALSIAQKSSLILCTAWMLLAHSCLTRCRVTVRSNP